MDIVVDWIAGWTGNGKWALAFFPVLMGLLLFASLRLVKWSEVIMSKTKFGAGFIGGTLIATITSMPEMLTEITQGASGTPENGIGDDIGSNAFSVFLIGIGALIFIKFMFMNKLGTWTKVSLAISFGLSLILSILLWINNDVTLGTPGKYAIGIIPMCFFIFYLFSLWLSYKFGDEDEEPIDQEFVKKHTLKEGILKFTIASVALVSIAVFINWDVSAFQQGFGIPTDSIGGVFLAITTSLPEIVAFFVFMKKRMPSAAIASLVGSHFFNLGISFFGDLAYGEGPTFDKNWSEAEGSQYEAGGMASHAPLAFMTAIMIALLLIGMLGAMKWPELFKKKWVYIIAPSLVVITYVVGWALILTGVVGPDRVPVDVDPTTFMIKP